MFRNNAPFDLSAVPVQVPNAIQQCVWEGRTVHVLLVTDQHSDQTVYLHHSQMTNIPLLTVWELYTEDEDLCGYLFQTAAGQVTSSAVHLLVRSSALTRQFTVDDALAEGSVHRLYSTEHFNVLNYDIGATLVAQKAHSFMSRVLDKELA